jgi:hypothetical protein
MPLVLSTSGIALRTTITLLVILAALACRPAVAQLESIAADPIGTPPPFVPVRESRLATASAEVRKAIGPLRRLLDRSRSGSGWRKYLNWNDLEQQAASGANADVDTLVRLYRRLDSGENGLEMPAFAAVRRAVGGYLEAAGTASNPDAEKVYRMRLDRLAAAVAEAAKDGTPQALDAVGPTLARLEESGQAPKVVSRLRRALGMPNLLLEVDENLLGRAVNRVVDETAPINEVLLGARVCGTGHTTGVVLLDFQRSDERAAIDLVLTATNHSQTRGTKGPVTVHTLGTASVDARKRIFVDEAGVTSTPVDAHVSVSTKTAGIAVNKKCGQKLIRKIASRKVAQMQPQARAISEKRARERVRTQFEAQTADVLRKAASDYQSKFRGRLTDRGWFPEFLHFNSSDQRLFVTARKSLPDQLAAFSRPPAVASAAVLSGRIHESFFNNLAEQELAGRTLTKEELESQLEKAGREMPESLESEGDQPPWSITFAKRKPVELSVGDGTVKLTIRGSRYTSGDREFEAMDVWATYKVESDAGVFRLVRDGDVEIYPPGFVPGGGKKLSVQETSLRGILQKRFNKVFDEVVEMKPLELPGELKPIGPLPMEQLAARKDGWIVAGWRQPDAVVPPAVTIVLAQP